MQRADAARNTCCALSSTEPTFVVQLHHLQPDAVVVEGRHKRVYQLNVHFFDLDQEAGRAAQLGGSKRGFRQRRQYWAKRELVFQGLTGLLHL